jgi:hypothetical protein
MYFVDLFNEISSDDIERNNKLFKVFEDIAYRF